MLDLLHFLCFLNIGSFLVWWIWTKFEMRENMVYNLFSKTFNSLFLFIFNVCWIDITIDSLLNQSQILIIFNLHIFFLGFGLSKSSQSFSLLLEYSLITIRQLNGVLSIKKLGIDNIVSAINSNLVLFFLFIL